MSSKPKPYHHGDLKSALISAARNILKEKGADAISLRAIAAEVGVSHMAPYTHFKNKKDLLQAIAATGYDELTERLLKVEAQYTNPWDLVLHYGVEHVQFAIDNSAIYRLMLSQVDTGGRRNKVDPEIAQGKVSLSPELESSSQKPFRILRQAFDTGELDDVYVTARALGAWSMVHGMSALIIDGHMAIPVGMSIEEFLSIAVSRKVLKVYN